MGSHSANRESPARALLVDIGDTLIPATAVAADSLAEAAGHLRRSDFIRDPAAFETTYRRVDASFAGPDVNHLFSSIQIARRVGEALRVKDTMSFAGTLLALYRDAVRRRIVRNEHLVRIFEKLRALGCRVGIVTDGTIVEQSETLFRLGLLQLVDALVTSEELGVEKPAPEMFRVALHLLGIDNPSEATMIGDSLERDIAGAKTLGMQTVLTTEFVRADDEEITRAHPDYVIRNLSELPELLGQPVPHGAGGTSQA